MRLVRPGEEVRCLLSVGTSGWAEEKSWWFRLRRRRVFRGWINTKHKNLIYVLLQRPVNLLYLFYDSLARWKVGKQDVPRRSLVYCFSVALRCMAFNSPNSTAVNCEPTVVCAPDFGEMFRTAIMMVASLALTSTVIAHAYYLKHQFYPTVVYLTKSSPSMAVLYIQAFVLVFLLGKFMGKVFFGQLRAAEMEHLLERSWYAVTETCLAFTVFRDDFSPRFVALFTLLLFLKCFHWLAEDRVDFMERSPNISWLFHFRIVSLIVLLAILDFLFVSHAYHSILTRGASVQLVFGFEYAILMTMVLTVFIKYLLHSIDLQSENPWDNKAVFMLYTELFTGFIKVLLYMAFMTIMIKVHTFPLFAIRPMYLAMRQFKKAVTDAIMSRRAIRNMNTLYPDATPEELQAMDNVCIICREEMVMGAKRLPCNHIFHTSCLRSWFQRQQTCPTCRMDVLRASLPTQSQPPPEQPEGGGQHPPPNQAPLMPPAPNFPQGLLPPFPPGMFPLWPPMAPFPPVPGVQPPNNANGASAGPPPGSQGAGADRPTGESASTSDTVSSWTGADRPTGDSASTSDTASSAGTVPGFPFPPPWMGMPFPPLFGFPPMPVPPSGFAGLTEEELRAMEGHERQHLEARLQCLQNIHTLLDAAMLQINQYLTVLATIGMPRTAPTPPSASAPPMAPPETPTSPESNSSEATTSTSQPADSTSSPGSPEFATSIEPPVSIDKQDGC
uniref:RING-type E3 ubiquitin transferase n=1 Tax=Laticauda laticaudata TaxID=8630 RepID=A0A8C5WPX2_LATLA